ncbi:DUF6489 family protein [Inquilinus sp. CAU 1745]|uniref:DUF6489 family protein n=1 Tax=Inquilinus sp. CAU 1745 TaxID=3140369 RepID=UPI00325B5F92
MKVTIDIDCTPEEARAFLGLPDVKPMQDAMMAELTDKMRENLSAMDADSLMKTWLPAGLQNWEQLQKAFWGQASAGKSSGSDKS